MIGDSWKIRDDSRDTFLNRGGEGGGAEGFKGGGTFYQLGGPKFWIADINRCKTREAAS